eukprot:1160777-Pelagomonas_calceolata.AAC.10
MLSTAELTYADSKTLGSFFTAADGLPVCEICQNTKASHGKVSQKEVEISQPTRMPSSCHRDCDFWYASACSRNEWALRLLLNKAGAKRILWTVKLVVREV